MFNQKDKAKMKTIEEAKEKEFLVKAFNSERKYFYDTIDGFKNVKGNSKYVSDALALFWTEVATLFNSGVNKEYTDKIFSFLLTILEITEYKTKEELNEFFKIYLFLIDQNCIRGFNLNDEITSKIREDWFRIPLIKATDYLLFPDCIDSYKNYDANVDENDCTQWELFDWIAELVSDMREYENLIRLLILNKRM